MSFVILWILAKLSLNVNHMSERWNKDIKVIDPHELLSDEATARAMKIEPQNKFEYHELQKTKEEAVSIEMVNGAANQVLDILELENITVPPESIHVLDKEEFYNLEQVRYRDVHAFYVFGDVFLRRVDTKEKFIEDLSHEFAHAISYYMVRNFVRPPTEQGIKIIKRAKRLGYSVHLKADQGAFVGVNEGMAELFSQAIRHEISDQLLLEDEEQKKKFTAVQAYYPQIVVLGWLFNIIGNGDGEAGWRECLKGLVTGDMSMFKKIEKWKRGSVKILSEMGSTIDDALDTARKLGLDEVVEEIQDYIKWQEEK